MSLLAPVSSFFSGYQKGYQGDGFSTQGKFAAVRNMGNAFSQFASHSLKKPLSRLHIPLSQGREWIHSGFKEGTYTLKKVYETTFDFFPKSNLDLPLKFSNASKVQVEPGLFDISAGAVNTPDVPPVDPGAPVPADGPNTASSATILPSLQPVSDIVSKIHKKALAALPLFLFALYTSKEEHLQNVNLTIKAQHPAKVYQIGLGVEDGSEISLAIEILAGKPVKFLQDKEALTSSEMPNAIFKPQSSLFTRALGPLKHLIWKRQDAFTSCNIIIEDAGNPLLQNGPLTAYIQASEREGFYIFHKDPNITLDNSDASDFVMWAEDTPWASYKALSVTVSDPISPKEEHHKQIIPLPFDENQSGQYLSISQWQ